MYRVNGSGVAGHRAHVALPRCRPGADGGAKDGEAVGGAPYRRCSSRLAGNMGFPHHYSSRAAECALRKTAVDGRGSGRPGRAGSARPRRSAACSGRSRHLQPVLVRSRNKSHRRQADFADYRPAGRENSFVDPGGTEKKGDWRAARPACGSGGSKCRGALHPGIQRGPADGASRVRQHRSVVSDA